MPTIRSRCQIIRFAPVPATEIERLLIQKTTVTTEDANLLARTAQGSIGRALSADIEDYRARRESMLAALNALTISGDRVQLLRSAEGLAAAKDRSDYEQSLDVLESLIRDAWALALGRPQETITNSDLLNDLKKIAAELTSGRAALWLSEIEELRAALIVNINRRVASDALMMAMAG